MTVDSPPPFTTNSPSKRHVLRANFSNFPAKTKKDLDPELKKYQFCASLNATLPGTDISVLAYQSIQSQARRGY
jgi:hypothetical protein